MLALNLVCESGKAEADIVVVENLESDYLLFEEASDLINQGKARLAIVLVQSDGKNPNELELVPQGIAEVMIRVARLRNAALTDRTKEAYNPERSITGGLKHKRQRKYYFSNSGNSWF